MGNLIIKLQGPAARWGRLSDGSSDVSPRGARVDYPYSRSSAAVALHDAFEEPQTTAQLGPQSTPGTGLQSTTQTGPQPISTRGRTALVARNNPMFLSLDQRINSRSRSTTAASVLAPKSPGNGRSKPCHPRAATGGSPNRRVPTGPLRRPGIHSGAVSMVRRRRRGWRGVERCEKSTIPESCRDPTIVGWSSVTIAGRTWNPPSLSASIRPWNPDTSCSFCGRTTASAVGSGAAAGPEFGVSGPRGPRGPETIVGDATTALGSGLGGEPELVASLRPGAMGSP